MPGQRWLRFARSWFDERTVDLVIEPLVADWRHEQSATRGWHAIGVNLRGQLAIFASTLTCLVSHAGKPLPMGLGSNARLTIGGFAALGTLLLVIPFAKDAPAVDIPTLLPAALCLSLPLAAVPALILATAQPAIPGRAARWLAFRAAIVLTAVMLPLAGWIMPGFNQAWREQHAPADSPRPVMRGGRELTLSQLFEPGVSSMVSEPIRKRELHNRVAVIVMPISLCALGIAASRRVRRPLRGALTWWLVAAACWVLAAPLAQLALRRPAGLSLVPLTGVLDVWAANLLVLAFAGLLRHLTWSNLTGWVRHTTALRG